MKITVKIVPKAQMRARHGVVNGFSRTYKDKRQVVEEEALMALLGPYQPAQPMQGQLLLGVKAYMPIPASKTKTFKTLARKGVVRPTTKPDLDNLLKHVKDCLSKLRFWGDDKLVVGYLPHTGKYYSDEPRWEIEILECPHV
ncbi:MAG: RusA family crossover junction endodeoxyribonuclease [Desulfovibrio sp.]|uniref:RusA family crossover junction endodeoxyribonuclease n=1 Tax=Desulfovibrio sp. TaxID=885 RepID=UPI002A36B431|nr:RusA family crossover junction endodeoxyribonuclease [Desulfovibrio sp.]MDY0258488.1 RusA family crossover junction endodeoxyribonuclease [Desulfovibrio sp.]